MAIKYTHRIINYLFASVWLINGLFCKVLNLVPRHEQIVAKIINGSYSRLLTFIIGICEIVMAVWVISRFKSRLNAMTQIIIVAAMNILESLLAPGLLLWGKLNLVFALIFIVFIYYNEFILGTKLNKPNP